MLVLAAALAVSSLALEADGVWGRSLDQGRGPPLAIHECGFGAQGVLALAIDPQTPATVYAVTEFGAHATKSGVFKSTNGGGSWRGVNVGLVQT